MKIAILLSLLAVSAFATHGVDVSNAVSEKTWSCLKSNGYSFAIVRVYQSFGRVDPNGAASIKAARAAGIPYVDGYIFPCHKCGNAAGQARDTVNALRNAGAEFGMIWADIEGSGEYWGSVSSNIAFIDEMISELQNMGVKVGIYSSKYQWTPITGDSKKHGDLPIWYAHYDEHASFSDFQPFGGWSKPAIKQYGRPRVPLFA